MKIIKVYRENLPVVKLIGKRYTNADRNESGNFANQWQQWFSEGWFDELNQCKRIEGVSDDYIGAMHATGKENEFEYWIGSFMSPDSEIPGGFESIEIPAGDTGVCWLYGSEQNGEIYGQEASDMCMAAFSEKEWTFSSNGWFFERYNCPRYTEPDEKGNVILDICAYLV